MTDGGGGNDGGQRRSGLRGAGRTLVAAATFAGAALALVAVVATGSASCLADLPPVPVDGSTPAPLPAPVCGDGIIQRDAGEACDPGDSGAPGCDACAVECPAPAYLGLNDHCYFALDAGKPSATEAMDACAGQGAHVVTFNGNDERQRVDSANLVPGGLYWVGLSLETPADKIPVYDAVTANEPGWRSTCAGCYGPMLPAGASLSYFPNACAFGRGLIVDCVAHAAATNDAFFGFDCNGSCVAGDAGAVAAVSTVCEREPLGLSGQACDEGAVCITLPSTMSFYELDTSAVPRAEAAMACASKAGPAGKPGHLVIFQTADEREQLSAELVARTPAGLPQLTYWVGLRASASSWTWDDGEAVTQYPLEWADGEPTSGAGAAYGLVAQEGSSPPFDRQLLRTSPGTEPRPYVCEFDP